MRKITLFLMLFCMFVGTAWAQEIRGVKEVPTTAIDFSSESLTTGYYLIKQTNTADNHGYLKANSEAVGAVVTPTETAPTPNAENEATYIWYVEVNEGKFSIATANKKAAWQAPTQKQKTLVAYENRATTLELESDFASLSSTTQTLVKAWWEEQGCYSYVHASGGNLGSWNDQNTQSLYYLEFYPLAESNLVVVDELAVLKTPLVELVAQTSSNINLGSITLQTTDPNAPFYLSATVQGDAPISAAIDNNPATHYGSTWGSAVGHHHYWQVDLVDAANLEEFKFSYITRDNGKDIPTKINVQGSTDGVTFTDIVVLTEELPTAGGVTYNSATIANDGYRYIRFEVPSTTTNFSAAGNAEQEVTISVAEFRLKYADVNDYSAKDKAIVEAIAAAQEVIDNPAATEEDINNAWVNLKMASLEKPTYPFTVTTDDSNPVVYAIKSGRGEGFWYTYDATDGKIALSPYTAAQTQLWYFKEVVTEDYKYALQLFPYTGEGKAMSYENTGNGAAKIVAQALNTNGWNNYWTLVAGSDGKYALQTYDKANYLSNNGGTANKMGMWNAGPDSDAGTAMYFTDPATAVQDLIDQAQALIDGNSTGVGYLTSACVTNLTNAVAATKQTLQNKDYSVDVIQDALNNLEFNMPEEGEFYVLQNAYTSKYMTVGNNGGGIVADAISMSEVFTFEDAGNGKYYLRNVERGTYLSSAPGTGGGQVAVSGNSTSEAKAVTLNHLGKANQLSIVPDGGVTIHHDTNYGTIVGWAAGVDSKSAWNIAKLNNIENYAHTLNVTSAEWATLVLGYNAEIPDNVTVYAVSELNENAATLTEVKNTIPAGAAVLINAAEGAYVFNYTESADAIGANLLKGTTVDANIAENAYVLGMIEGEVGLYTATMNANEGAAFLNNAFKAYLPKTNNAAQTLRFNFGETTGIEGVIEGTNANAVIFDLSGRRVVKMQKGIYIVNGKKVYVK